MWRGIGAVLCCWLEGDFWILAWFGRVAGEPVVHRLDAFSEFWLGFADSPGASGPLSKVDHWLDDFPDFWPGFGLFSGASGPLFKVGHWLDDFPGFWPGFGDSPGASGLLSKVGH